VATKYIYMTGVFEYAKVFENNLDRGSDAPDAQDFMKRLYERGGQTAVNFYPADNEEYQKLLDTGWVSLGKATMGNQLLHEGNPEFGIGKYLVFKRPVQCPFPDKNGVPQDWKAMPDVKDMTNGSDAITDWDSSALIGNGSKGVIKVSVYKVATGYAARLEALAIEEHVEYESEGGFGF
jgi:hypothetical protein